MKKGEKMKVLVSACLMGHNCKYNGGNNQNDILIEYLKDKQVVCVCPEITSGLGAPRPCVEIVDGEIRTKEGENYQKEYQKGVDMTLESIKGEKIDLCVLMSRSPTCGVNTIYDGTFSGRLVPGQGMLAKALIDSGYNVIDVADLEEYIKGENTLNQTKKSR